LAELLTEKRSTYGAAQCESLPASGVLIQFLLFAEFKGKLVSGSFDIADFHSGTTAAISATYLSVER
jgi:hypothetical protein